jgi:hypothetical protein
VTRSVAAATLALFVFAPPEATRPIRGLTAAATIAAAYDAIIGAEFTEAAALIAEACGPAPREACAMLDASVLWWQIALDPADRSRDTAFTARVDAAIAAADDWTRREPQRAEAWFYLGASYGLRAQWRVLREERLAAARDGKRIKESLEAALHLDPELHDANFGIGMYRYYADVAPATQRLLRWLLLLPGGDREEGLAQMLEARAAGEIMDAEADYQLHLVYLWYENRAGDALTLIQQLQARYPRNPLFHQIEAEILDRYLHHAAGSYASSADLLAQAEAGLVYDAPAAAARARFNMALQLRRLGRDEDAARILDALIAERPARPSGLIDSLYRARAAR